MIFEYVHQGTGRKFDVETFFEINSVTDCQIELCEYSDTCGNLPFSPTEIVID